MFTVVEWLSTEEGWNAPEFYFETEEEAVNWQLNQSDPDGYKVIQLEKGPILPYKTVIYDVFNGNEVVFSGNLFEARSYKASTLLPLRHKLKLKQRCNN